MVVPQHSTLEKREPEVWEKRFLAALAKTGNVSKAAAAAKVDRTTPYKLRDRAPDFGEAWAAAMEEAGDVLEAEAFRRAVKGVKKPVFYLGKQVDTVTEYSDTLLIFLLKGAKPDKYRDRHEHSGPNGGPIPIDPYAGLTDDERADRIMDILDRGRARRAEQAAGGAEDEPVDG